MSSIPIFTVEAESIAIKVKSGMIWVSGSVKESTDRHVGSTL